MSISLKLATSLMRWGSRNKKFGHQDCYTASFVRRTEGGISIATRREFEDGAGFFLPFAGALSVEDFAGKDVLDLGCGHGGRTAYYLLHGDPRSITGLEISFERTSVARESAQKLSDDDRMSFAIGFGEALPFSEESFDIILSYDVFEHVSDLPRVLDECYRTLRPGGRLFALFPPYYGPRAHHLDFITTLPFLHHLFSPRILVEAANTILKEQPQFRDVPVAPPRISYLKREVLPGLNGTTERDFFRMLSRSPFHAEKAALLPFAWGPGGVVKRVVRNFCRLMLKLPWPFTRDIFAGTIVCVLRKPVRNKNKGSGNE
ncbi:MAG: class I SAM-dependent methyltransferase [Acidobacteriota bacterium]